MFLHYVCHVSTSQGFKNEYADVSYIESFSTKLYTNVFTLYTTLRFSIKSSHERFQGL